MTTKPNGSKLILWVLQTVFVILMAIGGWWFAGASDTLKTAVTQDSLDKTLTLRGLTTRGISDQIKLETGVSQEQLKNTSGDVKELKDDFKEFKTDQEAKLKEFSLNQTEMMKLMIQINAKLDQQAQQERNNR